MRLSILIATVPERVRYLTPLINYFNNPSDQQVEILFDNTPRKEMSVGKKRQLLLEQAKGDYIVYFDDDDWPMPDYVEQILKATESNPDTVGFKIIMTTDYNNLQTCVHSLKNKSWDYVGGKWLRPVTHFNPVKRELALKAGFPDLRFGEDKEYSDRVTPLCKKEVFLDRYLFHYRYSTKEPHNKKYGIE